MKKRESLNSAILKYLERLNQKEEKKWISAEAYKFEFANFVQSNVDFEKQADDEILKNLIQSQSIKFDGIRGVQFIQKSGRKKLSVFLELKDIDSFRKYSIAEFRDVDWTDRSMSFTGLTAWLASLFPDKIYPVPITGMNYTINYLFETDLEKFPKKGMSYILSCQEYFRETELELRKFPFEEIHLKVWNTFFESNPKLNIKPKSEFEKVDWVWLVQDFHLFVYREILKRYNSGKNRKLKTISLADDPDFVATEGELKPTKHVVYERDYSLVKKIKEKALKSNPMLNCEVCGLSFYEKYGELGAGFIEAHHKIPLHTSKKTKTSSKDIALICSNCHKMIHKGRSCDDENRILKIEELRDIVENIAKGSSNAKK